jgi:hypothetical protein
MGIRKINKFNNFTTMRTLTFEILNTECVGDSLGKHNYNSLSLDTVICNLSSTIFNINNNILAVFNNLSSKSLIFDEIANNFSSSSCIKYNQTVTTVKLLSSYWSTPEITVHYESNLYKIDNIMNTNSYNSSLNVYVSSDSTDTLAWLRQNSLTYVTNNFPASNYNVNTILNLNVYNYHTAMPEKVLVNTYQMINNTSTYLGSSVDFSSYYSKVNDYSPSLQGYNSLLNPTNTLKNNYNDGVKSLNFEFFKDSVHVENIYTLKYKNINSKWNFIEIITPQ